MMAEKKYSVFISSTFQDLEKERNSVLRAILEHGHFPLGMELWGAANDQQWQIITRQIDVADYYVIIIAQKYGSTVDGVSWTEREYDYAIARGVPVLGFLLKDGAQWNTSHVDKGEHAEKLLAFRRKAKEKPVSFWTNAEDLRTSVVLALGREMQATPRIGWVRASEAMLPATANEIARLSEENAKLRTELAIATQETSPDVGFDIVRGTFQAREDRDPNGSRCVSFSTLIFLAATLRRGAAVGFAPRCCKIIVTSLPGVVNLTKIDFVSSKGAMIDEVKIDGPTSFQISASTDFIFWEDLNSSSEIQVVISIRPIGYHSNYSVTVPMKFQKEVGNTRRWFIETTGT
jgi:hypothetical protein